MDEQGYVVPIERYKAHAGLKIFERILAKSTRLRDLHVAYVDSTNYDDVVVELLSPLTLLLNKIGIRTGWRVAGLPILQEDAQRPSTALHRRELQRQIICGVEFS